MLGFLGLPSDIATLRNRIAAADDPAACNAIPTRLAAQKRGSTVRSALAVQHLFSVSYMHSFSSSSSSIHRRRRRRRLIIVVPRRSVLQGHPGVLGGVDC